MKEISPIYLSRLRIEEDFGFLKLILATTECLPAPSEAPESLANARAAFETAFAAFDEALSVPESDPTAQTAFDADMARSQAWRVARNYVKAMVEHPDEELAAAAQELKSIFDKYGPVISLSQIEKSGILHNLLQDLEDVDAEKRAALAFDGWLDNLRAREADFQAANDRRLSELIARRKGIVRSTREAADAAYRSLITTVNALALLEGEERYAQFIDPVNGAIKRQKAILKARATNSERKRDEEEAE